MRGKVWLGVVALGVAAVMIALQIQERRLAVPPPAARAPSPASATVSSTSLPSSSPAVSSRPAANAKAGLPDQSPAIDPEFDAWIQNEAKSLDEVQVDGERKQVELRRVLADLNDRQVAQLAVTVNRADVPARARILSAYLLVEGGVRTREELRRSITAPLIEQGPHDVHSEDELRGVREKSLRIMMIDGLFAQSHGDPVARAALARAAVESTDPFIQAYARDKLNQLSR